MKTIRLLYPDYLSGGMEAYYFGANLLTHILPENENQPLVKVELTPPDKKEYDIVNGIYAKNKVIDGISLAKEKIINEKPDRIITIGGNCMVSLAPFDYLHGIYKNTGIIWIDAHPDVSTPQNNYPNAHAMVLSSLLGDGDNDIILQIENPKFKGNEILYVGLQELHDYQEQFLNKKEINYRIQSETFLPDDEIITFIQHFEHILIHLDIDVLDANAFHSTYFANQTLVGDGSGGGKMTLKKLSNILKCITENSDVVGFTIAEYLPFDEYELHNMFSDINIFKE